MKLQGIIFPDIIKTFIECGIVQSNTDFQLKNLKLIDPSLKRDKQIFREHSEIEKDLNAEDRTLSQREIRQSIRKTLKEIKKIIPFECEFKVSLSDFRSQGNWLAYKGFFTSYKSTLSPYVLDLCEKEKQTLSSINKISDEAKRSQLIIKTARDVLHISDSLFDKLNTPITTRNQNEQVSIVNKFKAAITIHQFLHLAAIIEHEMYGIEKYEFNGINRLLPKFDAKGNVIGSVNHLIQILFKKLGFSTFDKFVMQLSIDNMDQYTKNKRKLNRWKTVSFDENKKSKATPFTLKNFNELITNPRNGLDIEDNIQQEIIIIAIVFDNIYRETLSMGMKKEWIINEFSKYSRYQDFPTHLAVV